MDLLDFKRIVDREDMVLDLSEQMLNKIESSADRLIAEAYFYFVGGQYESAASELLQASSFIEPDELADKVRIMFSFDDCVECGLCSCIGCEVGGELGASCGGGPCACICALIFLNGFGICDLYSCMTSCCDFQLNCCKDCLH